MLFKSAEISKFAVHERKQYFEDMTTQEDIKRMIAFAEDRGMERGMDKGIAKMAKAMKAKGYSVADICEISGLDERTVASL